MKRTFLLAVAMLLTMICTPAQAAGIQVEGAWVRAAPPTVQVLAGYMTIKNTGKVGKTVIGAHSPQFAKVEFHETLMRNGMATMVARDSLVIDAGNQVVLAPGGYHMMLIAPQRMIRAGDTLDLTLHFSDRTAMAVKLEVRKGSGMAMDHSKMDHGNMMQHQQHQNMMQHNNMAPAQGMMMPNKAISCQNMMQHNKGGACPYMKDGTCPYMKDGKCLMGKDGKCPCMKDGECQCMGGMMPGMGEHKMDHKGMSHM